MSALLTFILGGGIVTSSIAECRLFQSRSGLPRDGGWGKIGEKFTVGAATARRLAKWVWRSAL
jgi:hypothetical protein